MKIKKVIMSNGNEYQLLWDESLSEDEFNNKIPQLGYKEIMGYKKI